ncbi:MAG: isocitrate lyase/phosphoenolpyruvate mutase family protein [Pseudomonadota bacterium]
MNQIEKARAFADLHEVGNPLVLYNAWDAGSAKAIADGGAPAIATGSWSVAAAQGYGDGQKIPLDLLQTIAAAIVQTVDVPVTIDFEGAYAAEPEEAAANVERIIQAGAIGINFEDQVVGGDGLYEISVQAGRIAAIRRRAEQVGVPFFINARTDLFLKEADRSEHKDLIAEAKERAGAFAEAGASGFFAPALVEEGLISDLAEAISLPLNIMMMKGAPSTERLGELGVSRVSYGPGPYREAMRQVTEAAKAVY